MIAATSLAFASFVYPWKGLRVAAYRHEPIRVNEEFSSRGVFQSRGFDTRDTAFTAQRTLEIVTYGVSVAHAYRNVWLGAGLSWNRFSLGFEFERFLHEPLVGLYGAPDPKQSVSHYSQTGDASALGAVLGFLMPVAKTVKVGASYRRMSSVEFSSFSGGLLGTQERSTADFNVPDVVAAGLSARIKEAFLITTEYKHVFHSQLRSDYVDVIVTQGETKDRASRFTIDDANEVHFGAQYLLPIKTRPALRAGAWFDPDHSVHYAPTPANDLTRRARRGQLLLGSRSVALHVRGERDARQSGLERRRGSLGPVTAVLDVGDRACRRSLADTCAARLPGSFLRRRIAPRAVCSFDLIAFGGFSASACLSAGSTAGHSSFISNNAAPR